MSAVDSSGGQLEGPVEGWQGVQGENDQVPGRWVRFIYGATMRSKTYFLTAEIVQGRV